PPGAALPEHPGDPLFRPPAGEPGPGKETFDRHPQAVPRGRHGLEKRCRSGLQVAGHQDFSVMVHDTDVPAPSMQVNAAVKWVLFGVASHEVSSSPSLLVSHYRSEERR